MEGEGPTVDRRSVKPGEFGSTTLVPTLDSTCRLPGSCASDAHLSVCFGQKVEDDVSFCIRWPLRARSYGSLPISATEIDCARLHLGYSAL